MNAEMSDTKPDQRTAGWTRTSVVTLTNKCFPALVREAMGLQYILYNGQNRMVSSEVTEPAQQYRSIVQYRYDAFGRRTITQEAGGDAMRTVYDGFSFDVIREGVTFVDGSLTSLYATGPVSPQTQAQIEGLRYRYLGEDTSSGIRYRNITESTGEVRYTGIGVTLYGNGEAVAVSRSASTGSRGGAAYLGKDLMGSVRSTTGDMGTLEDRYEYDAFGKPYKGDFNSGMSLGYTGKPYDQSTGLYDYGYRDYKPELARFTTVDPIRDGANWFAYVNNDPANFLDPWGLECEKASDKQAAKDTLSQIGNFFKNMGNNIANTIVSGVNTLIVNPIKDAVRAFESFISPPKSSEVDNFIRSNVDGPFQQIVKDAFGPDVKVTTLPQDTTAYRYYGGISGPSSYWSTPNKVDNPRSELALPPGNTAQYVDSIVIPQGTTILEGTVAPNFGQPGGGYQYYVPK